MEIAAAKAGRFYGDGQSWALALPLPALLRWLRLIPMIEEHEGIGRN